MNLTISVDDEVLHRALEVARQHGTSLDSIVRAYLETLAGRQRGAALVKRLEAQWKRSAGRSDGPFTRDDASAERT